MKCQNWKNFSKYLRTLWVQINLLAFKEQNRDYNERKFLGACPLVNCDSWITFCSTFCICLTQLHVTIHPLKPFQVKNQNLDYNKKNLIFLISLIKIKKSTTLTKSMTSIQNSVWRFISYTNNKLLDFFPLNSRTSSTFSVWLF